MLLTLASCLGDLLLQLSELSGLLLKRVAFAI